MTRKRFKMLRLGKNNFQLCNFSLLLTTCIGGQGTWKQFLTLPNILKEFNPKLIGYAYGDSLAEQRFSQFNVAEVGALSRDIPFMTRELVKRIKMDRRVNISEDWKVKRENKFLNSFLVEQ